MLPCFSRLYSLPFVCVSRQQTLLNLRNVAYVASQSLQISHNHTLSDPRHFKVSLSPAACLSAIQKRMITDRREVAGTPKKDMGTQGETSMDVDLLSFQK